jgi:hypothetical protein
MTLKDWIKETGGNNEAAKLLDVSVYTLRGWLRGEGSPTYGTAVKIIRLSKMKIDFFALYKFTTRNPKAPQK